MSKFILASQFDTEATEGTVVIKFEIDNCPPCQAYDNWIKDLEREFRHVLFLKLNLTDPENVGPSSQALKSRFRFKSVPYVIVLQDNKVILERLCPDQKEIHEALEKALTS